MGHPPNIPLMPSTNELNFPRWAVDAPPGKSGHPYPHMLTREFLPEHKEAWVEEHKQYDEQKNKYFWSERCPRARVVRKNGMIIPGDQVPILSNQDLVDQGFAVRLNEPVVVKSLEEEIEVCEILGIPTPHRDKKTGHVQTVEISMQSQELELLREQNALLQSRNAELEAETVRSVQETAARKERAEAKKVAAKPSRSQKMKEIWAKRKAAAAKGSPAVEAAKKRSLEQIATMGEEQGPEPVED